MRIYVILLAIFHCTMQVALGQLPKKIYWTGPLKGHVRSSSLQDFNGGKDKASKGFTLLQQMLTQRDRKKDLLLGLGSNFAWSPEATWIHKVERGSAGRTGREEGNKSYYYWLDEQLMSPARNCSLWVDVSDKTNPNCKAGTAKLKGFDFYVSHHGRGTVPYDNVGDGLKSLGYNALAIGPDDLAFGPERLRQYARLLFDNGSGPQLLASNLVIGVKRDPPVRKLPKYLQNEKKYEDAGADFPVKMPKEIYPWLPSLVWSANAAADATVYFFKAKQKGRPEELEETPTYTVERKDAKLAIPLLPEQLRATDSWGVCFHPAGKPKPTCALYTVAQPFFSELPSSGLGTHKSRMPPKPYYWHEASKTAVFGIVGSDLVQQVGVRATSWSKHAERDDELDENVAIRAAVLDPVEALRQAQLRFEADHPSEQDRATRILLAHMPEEKAVAVARRLSRTSSLNREQQIQQQRTMKQPFQAASSQFSGGDSFHLVMAVASNRAPSVPQTLTRIKGGWRAVVQSASSLRSMADRGGSAKQHEIVLSQTEMTEETKTVQLKATNQTAKFELDYSLSTDYVKQLKLDLYLAAMKISVVVPAKANDQDNLNQAVLQAMMDAAQADAAMLQKSGLRSLQSYFETEANNLEQAVDRLFPRGDMLITRELSGATIKKLLDRSKELADEEESIFVPGEQEGRSLLVRGFAKSPNSGEYEWLGEPLQDKRIYRVAMSDYLAFGDVAYTDLKPEGPLFSFIRNQAILPLAVEVGRIWMNQKVEPIKTDPFYYFDHLDLLPPDSGVKDFEQPGGAELKTIPATSPTLQNGSAEIVTDESVGAGAGGEIPVPAATASATETPWRLTFRSVNSLDTYHHNEANEASRVAKLGGITTPQFVTNPESVKWGALNRFLLEHIGSRQTFFVRGEENFRADRIRNKDTNAFTRATPENLWAIESGFSFRRLRYDRWSLHPLTTVRYESQLLKPLIDLPLFGGKVDGTKTSSILGKTGIRYERRLSAPPTAPAPASPPFTYGFVEAGFLFGRSYGIPSTIVFGRRAMRVDCSLTTASSAGALETCVKERVIPQLYPEAMLNGIADAKLLNGVLANEPRDAQGALASQQFVRGMNRPRAGIFLDVRLVSPLWRRADPKPWSLLIENRGQLLFSFAGDISTDTRYFDTQTFGLQVPIVGNLKLLPKLDFLFFRNQFQGATLTGRRFSLSLEYNFERNGRTGWKKALQSPAVTEW